MVVFRSFLSKKVRNAQGVQISNVDTSRLVETGKKGEMEGAYEWGTPPPGEMDEVFCRLEQIVTCGEKLVELRGVLCRHMLHDVWKLGRAIRQGSVLEKLLAQVFNMEDDSEALTCVGFRDTFILEVQAACARHPEKNPFLDALENTASSVGQMKAELPVAAPAHNPADNSVPGKIAPGLDGVVSKAPFPHMVVSLPQPLLDAADELKRKAMLHDDGKLTEFRMRDYVNQLLKYCLTLGVVNKEDSPQVLFKVECTHVG